MKLIIDIPEDLYKATVNGLEADEIWDLRLAVKNGTPLDDLKADLHATAEMHDDGDYYLRDEWIDEYFDDIGKESEGE